MNERRKKSIRLILLGILILTASLRLYHITYHDSYTDEAILSFRSLGMIDYDASPAQTTPWQWLPAVPWWGHLSMHDHPIGFFLFQHASFRLFGEHLFAVRLPSVLAGVASMYLLFLIGKKLCDERVGLVASAILAIQSYHLWMSRLGIQDGAVIALMLLALWLYLLALEEKKYWLLLGAICGIGIITKYTFIIIFPIILWHAIVNRVVGSRDQEVGLRNRFFWCGIGMLILFSSPTWLYNIFLYRATGHFDFQISAALGQEVPQWAFRMGRSQVGGLSDRFINFFVAMRDGNSLLFNGAAIFSVLWSAWDVWKRRNKAVMFFLGATILSCLWFLIIGSTYRFVVMSIPFFVLLISACAVSVYAHKYVTQDFSPDGHVNRRGIRTKVLSYIGVLFFLTELLFSINTFLLPTSFGRQNIAYAKVNEETNNLGFNQLGVFLEKELSGKMSAAFGQPDYQFLTTLVTNRIEEQKKLGRALYPLVIIYDHNINFVAGLWYLQRLLIYDGWPMVPDDTFLTITRGQFDDFYRAQGIQHFLYIAGIGDAVLKPNGERITNGKKVKEHLKEKGIVPEIVRNAHGDPAFAVYRF